AREAREPGREAFRFIAEARAARDHLELAESERQAGDAMVEKRVAQAARQRREPPRERIDRVLRIAGEQLVAAFAREHDRDGLPGELGDEVRRNRGGLRDGL